MRLLPSPNPICKSDKIRETPKRHSACEKSPPEMWHNLSPNPLPQIARGLIGCNRELLTRAIRGRGGQNCPGPCHLLWQREQLGRFSTAVLAIARMIHVGWVKFVQVVDGSSHAIQFAASGVAPIPTRNSSMDKVKLAAKQIFVEALDRQSPEELPRLPGRSMRQ